MSKMNLHDPFGHSKHKLWPKEGLGVKLTIWIPTIKSQASHWLPCVQVACHISLESSQWGLQLWFRPHLNRRSSHKVMNPKVTRVLVVRILVLVQNDIWVLVPWPCTKYTIRGKVVWVIDLLDNLLSPDPGVLGCPFTFEVLRAKERPLIPSSSVVFTFGLTVQSIKELGGVSFSFPKYEIFC
jgi:heme/copper-type cytochrome/quinol oxidase subunit 4